MPGRRWTFQDTSQRWSCSWVRFHYSRGKLPMPMAISFKDRNHKGSNRRQNFDRTLWASAEHPIISKMIKRYRFGTVSFLHCQKLWSSRPTIKFFLLGDQVHSIVYTFERSLFMHIYKHVMFWCNEGSIYTCLTHCDFFSTCLPAANLPDYMFFLQLQVRCIRFLLIVYTHGAAWPL